MPRAFRALLLSVLATMPLGAQRPRRPAEPALPRIVAYRHVRTLAALGFPNGLALEGLNAERVISFALPGRAPVDSARLHLVIRFSRLALPESNLQLFANNVRLGGVTRHEADSAGFAQLDLSVPRSFLGSDFLTLTLRSAVTVSRDRCYDERLGLAYVTLDQASSFAYDLDPRLVTTVRQVWSMLPDTVALAFPSRKLTPDEFRAAYTVGIAATNAGHALTYVRLPALGDVVIGGPTDFQAAQGVEQPPAAGSNLSVFRYAIDSVEHVGIAIDAQRGGAGGAFLAPQWAALSTAPSFNVRAAGARLGRLNDSPTFAELGLTNLRRDMAVEATWQLPLDLREFPAGRVPSRVRLQLVTAPNTSERQLVLFAFLNGTLVRSVDISTTGAPQAIDIHLPSSLLVTANELRLVLQRHLPPAEACTQRDISIPAQVLPASQVFTTAADAHALAFSGVASQVSPGAPVYLPGDALDAPQEYLPLLVSIGRAFWSADRAPTPEFFGSTSPPAPTTTFFIIGRPANQPLDGPVAVDSGRFKITKRGEPKPLLDVASLSAWSVVQVVSWNGHVGVQILPAVGSRHVPDWPAAYDANTLVLAGADTSLFQLNTSDRDAGLLFNDGPSILERIRGDWLLWLGLLILIIGPPLVLAIRAIIKRTPRRQLSRNFSNPPPPPPSGPSAGRPSGVA